MIRPIPESERPRERCLRQGARALSFRECLALLLGSGPPGVGSLGVAARILDRPGGELPESEKERAYFTALEISAEAHLAGIPGLGGAGRARLLASFELGRRYSLHRLPTSPSVPAQSLARSALSRIGAELRAEPREWLGFVPVYRGGQLGPPCVVELGTRTHVNVDPAELFARVLALRPAAFFLFHNHPSGHTLPSPEDVDLTERVARVASQLGVRLLGHWVVATGGESEVRGS